MFEGPLDQDPEARQAKIEAITTAPSQSLAAHVALYRMLGFDKEFAKLCMQELLRRKNAGDDFDYEGFIATQVEQAPKPTNMTSMVEDLKKNIMAGIIKNLGKK